MFVLCVVSKEKPANCRTVKTKKPERMDYKKKNKKKNHGGMEVSCECCVCCQVEVSVTGRSLVQRNRTDCGVCI